MASSRPSYISTVLRLAASSIFLPVLLVGGLLASPVSCQCGSALPHDHSLFILGTHTHSPDEDRSQHFHDTEQQDQSATASNAAEAQVEGPTMRAASDFASGEQRAVSLVLSTIDDGVSTITTPEQDGPPSDGCPVLPDPPPPQA